MIAEVQAEPPAGSTNSPRIVKSRPRALDDAGRVAGTCQGGSQGLAAAASADIALLWFDQLRSD